MDRRELLKMIATLTGGAVIGSEFFLAGCTNGDKVLAFTPETVSLLNEIGETILPATSTPGAKAADVGSFMQRYVTDCYSVEDRRIFLDGLQQLDEAAEKKFSSSFLKANPEQRKALLLSLEPVAAEVQAKRGKAFMDHMGAERAKGNQYPIVDFVNPVANHYYTMLKQLTLLGFFTSETGATQTLRYRAVPSRYDGAIEYHKGDKAWAEL